MAKQAKDKYDNEKKKTEDTKVVGKRKEPENGKKENGKAVSSNKR